MEPDDDSVGGRIAGATGPQPASVAAGAGATADDIQIIEAMRSARKAFADALVDAFRAAQGAVIDPRSRQAEQLRQLRQEPCYVFAEFFFLLDAFRIDSGRKIVQFAEAHNRHMQALAEDREARERLGLHDPAKIAWAILKPDQLEKLAANFGDGRPCFDQSDLARLMVTLMSSETCRQVAVLLAAAGLIDRFRSAYGGQLVRSNGRLEAVFAGHIAEIRKAVAGA